MNPTNPAGESPLEAVQPILDKLRDDLKTELLEDVATQRELLLGFLGKPRDNFFALLNSRGGPESRRGRGAKLISEWVAHNRPRFPLKIQGRMQRLAMLASSWTTDRGLDTSAGVALSFVLEDWALLEGYEALLRRTLLEHSNATGRDEQRKSGKTKFPTPPGSTWEHVRIRFRDGHTVSVRCRDVSKVYTYTEMGMADGRNKNPTMQWQLLGAFADEGGKIDWNSPGADRRRKKQVQLLAGHLMEFFGIKEHPFKPIWKGKKSDSDWKCIGWEAKFRIFPEAARDEP